MKRKLLQIIFSLLASLLCVTTLTGTAAVAVQAEQVPDLFDYGDGRTATNESISASELFDMSLGMAPSDAERDFFERFSTIRLFYNTSIPTQNIETA